VIKDLVSDLTNFFAQLASIEPSADQEPDASKGMAAKSRGQGKARWLVRMYPLCLLLDLVPKLLVE
jgi:succinate dehydrogenase/fumarate reductase-like Fe-S protein